VENLGFIEIHIEGSNGKLALSPDNYDIKEIIAVLQNAEDLLYPQNKKDRPLISYDIKEGSVKHILKTSIQYIIGFNAIVGQISQEKNIDFLDLATAKAFENIQKIALNKDYVFNISTSVENSNQIKLDRNTSYFRKESIWADAEFYFYGKVNDAGGKDKANIHLYTEDLGTIRIQTPITFLEQYEDNILYKNLGIRAIGKQHIETGQIDTSTLKFVDIVAYQPKYDEDYLNDLINKATENWSGISDKNAWLNEIRGGYEA
jgi:hypothetical protein